jgi:quercetin dioxygenase-like cupin family protein
MGNHHKKMDTLNILDLISFDEKKSVFRTLFQTSGSRLALLCVRGGQTVPEHSAPGPIVVQTLSGRAIFYNGIESFEMKAGTLLRLEASRAHRVEAQEDTVLLVTIFGAPM